MWEGSTPVRVQLLITGRVQGVGYRAFAYTEAIKRHLVGRVQNLEDGRVVVEVQGSGKDVDGFIQVLNIGPKLSRVDQIESKKLEPLLKDCSFVIDY